MHHGSITMYMCTQLFKLTAITNTIRFNTINALKR